MFNFIFNKKKKDIFLVGWILVIEILRHTILYKKSKSYIAYIARKKHVLYMEVTLSIKPWFPVFIVHYLG